MLGSVRFFLFLSSLVVLTFTAAAQSPEKILRQAAKAMGGEKALRNIKSRQVKGTVTRLSDGASGSYQALVMRPNLFASGFDLRGFELSLGFNGKSAWSRDSRDGLRTLTGTTSRDFQTEALYRNSLWLDYKRDKSKVTLRGPAIVEGRTVNIVTLTTARNVQIKMFFDAGSALLVREEISAGEASRAFDYADHRTINGVMEPYAITAVIGGEKYQIKIDEITHNPALTPAIFDFPKASDQPLPDIAGLLKEVDANEDAIDKLLEKYTYTETMMEHSFDKSGVFKDKESQTYELTFYHGNRIRRLIAKNDQPLSAEDQAKEDKRLEKRIHDIEKKETEKQQKSKEEESAQSDPDDGEHVTISDVLRASRLINPRRERFRSRDVIVFDFEPLPGYKPRKTIERLFGKMAGVIWVDAADRQVARLEARLVDSFKIGGGLLASLKPGGSLVFEQDRINNEIWLPTRADLNISARVLLLRNFDAFATITYGNYKRFNVESEKEKLRAPGAEEKKP